MSRRQPLYNQYPRQPSVTVIVSQVRNMWPDWLHQVGRLGERVHWVQISELIPAAPGQKQHDGHRAGSKARLSRASWLQRSNQHH